MITRIEELHNLSVKDAANMPSAVQLLRWEGRYHIDAEAGRFVVTDNQPRIQSGRHAGRVDLNAVRAGL